MKKLENVCHKMQDLGKRINEGKSDEDLLPEDIEVMKEEQAGMMRLVLEDPAELNGKINQLSRVFSEASAAGVRFSLFR